MLMMTKQKIRTKILFEKFTEKAINVIVEAQNTAIYDHSSKVLSEHLLLALVKETKGFCSKIFNSYNITYERLAEEIYMTLNIEESDMTSSIPFSEDFKQILKQTMNLVEKSENRTVHYEHLVLAAISDKNSKIAQYLENLGFDIEKSKPLIEKLVQRKVKKDFHPELDENKEPEINLSQETDALFDNKESSKIFERASSKLSASNYEILGTEQIVSSILEDKNSELVKILEDSGITAEQFEEMLSKQSSRKAEVGEKQIIFPPTAFFAMNAALQMAKELGSSEIKPEHLILGILKTQKGVACDVLEQMHIDLENLTEKIIRPIEHEMPQALTIL